MIATGLKFKETRTLRLIFLSYVLGSLVLQDLERKVVCGSAGFIAFNGKRLGKVSESGKRNSTIW